VVDAAFTAAACLWLWRIASQVAAAVINRCLRV
jgi:hypothetical protein